ncbi:MAG: ATP-binding protein, partial [Bacteroidota bacterium]|nr:ATP-binding protein [Bacteroidota bacterium]
HSATGIIEGVAIIGSEVTSQATLNKTIKESEERFRNLVEKAPTPICILKGEEMTLEVANEPVFKIWHVGKEALGKPFLEIIPEMKGQPFMGYLLDVFRNGITHYGSEEPAYFIRQNGEKQTIYFNFVYQPYREDDGTISGVMVLATDVTEQVVARKKMESQAMMVRDLLMNAPGFIATLSGPEHVYELVNEKYQHLFGKRKIQGKPIMVALPELEGQGFKELLDNVYNTGKPYLGIDIPIVLSRDEDLAPQLNYFNFSYQPMYDENKKIFSILVFGYEVTEQVQARNKSLEEHEVYSSILEERVKQRTLELSDVNEALLQKNEELKKMNHELESFTYVSSHDLQEPLRKIQTFATRILEKEHAVLSDNGKDYFQRMSNAARRMQTLLEDLLAYSHTNLTVHKFEKTDLNKIIEDVKVELAETLEEKAAHIESDGFCEASITPFQFRQILHNLISNSLKFSKPGIPTYIKISSRMGAGRQFQPKELTADKTYCHICFTDNGIGFHPEYKNKIFEVFQRLHGKEEYIGTGIGLAIVKKIVEKHGGIITATSELGEGATFDIYIPG